MNPVMPPAYVISLPRCTQRQGLLRAHFDAQGIPFCFLDGVDGAALPSALVLQWYDPAQFQRVTTDRPPLTAGEIGCALSHLQVWQRIAAGDAPGGFVFEDDVQMLSPGTPATLREVATLARAGEVVLLGCTARYTWPRQTRNLTASPHYLAFTLDDTMLSSAYYLTREGAALMVARWEAEGITFMVDHWYIRRGDRPSWAGTLPVLVLKPDLFAQRRELPSEIAALGRPGGSGAEWAAAKARLQPLNWRHPFKQGLKKLRRGVRRWATRPVLITAPPPPAPTPASRLSPPARPAATTRSPAPHCG